MSMVEAAYTPHSYIDYVVDGVTVTASQTSFSFPKEFLLLAHLQAWHYVASTGVWSQIGSGNVTFSGTSGSGTAVLGGGAPTRTVGDTIRLKRVTPDTGGTRVVDFQPGSLSEADLDTQAKQNLYIVQEVRDEMYLRLGLEAASEQNFDAGNKRIKNVRGPTVGTDVALYQNVLDLAVGSGNLPPITDENEGSFLVVVSGAWSVATAATAKTAMNLGSAADLDAGVGAGDLMIQDNMDARYFVLSKNLSDGTAATMRTNLGIPATNPAALLQTTDEGVAADRVVELDASSRYPAADGRNIDLSAHSLVGTSGRIGAIGRFKVGLYSQTFTSTPASIDIPAGALEDQLNAGADIAIDTGNDRFTLKTGTYWINVSLELTNEDGINETNTQWTLRRDVTGTPSNHHTHQSTVIGTKGSGDYHVATVGTWRKVIVSGATEVFDLQFYKVAPINGDPRVNYGTVFIVKVEN